MPDDALGSGNVSRFLDFLYDRTDENLRAVMIYADEGYRHLHLREDVRARYTDEELDDIADLFRDAGGDRSDQERRFDAGGLESTVYVFDDAIVVLLPRDDRTGAAVSLDRTVGSSLFSFVVAAREHLYGS